MGREIRRVPANWEHPRETNPNDKRGMGLHPMHGENFQKALAKWNHENDLWQKGQHERQLDKSLSNYGLAGYSEYAGDQPKQEDYVPYTEEEATHFQMYETITEGTPVTPVFATLQELEDYLVNVGEMAGTKYNEKYSREGAHAFCQSGWAPSMVYTPATGMISGVEASKIK
jgi:hypothetical protein